MCACVGDGDPTWFMWSLAWWPHALLHGANPFHPDVVWVPGGANLTQGGFAIPAAAIVAAPITLLAGPIVAYNVVSLLAPALVAWFTYRLCRYLTGALAPSLLGGYLFGFGTYMAAHLLGHLNLAFVFLVPAAVHLCLLRLDERLSGQRFGIAMAALIAVQILLSPEILLTGIGFGALALLLGYLVSDAERRGRIVRIVPPILAAGGAAAVVVSPYLYWSLKGLGDADAAAWRTFTALYPADAVNVIVPTPVTGLGHQWFSDLTAKFDLGTFAESSAYVGPVLLAIVVAYAVTRWRRPVTRVLVGVIAVSYVLSLGTKLHVAGNATDLPLPWAIPHLLPALDHVIPVRLFMYALLAIAIAVALWLAEPAGRGWRWAAALVGTALLVPNLSADFWRGRPTNPAFFTTDAYRAQIGKDEVVLAFPYGKRGSAMLWQAQTGMRFRLAEGYLSPAYPGDYLRDPFFPALVSGDVDRSSAAGLRDFIARRHVRAVVLDDRRPGAWPTVLAALRLRPVRSGGVLVYRVPAGWR